MSTPLRARIRALHCSGVNVLNMWDLLSKEGFFEYHKFKRVVNRMRCEGELPKRDGRATERRTPGMKSLDYDAFCILEKKGQTLGLPYRELCYKLLTICAKEPYLIDNILDGD